MPPPIKNNSFKYRFLHTGIWFTVALYTFISYYDGAGITWYQIIDATMIALLSAIPFYSTSFILVPRFLYTRKFLMLVLFSLLMITICSLLGALCERLLIHFFDPEVAIMPEPGRMGKLINYFVSNSLLFTFCGGALKVFSDRFRMEKEKISTELNFLRSQINPHFLFNILNTIYFQVDKTNGMARASIEKLSEMLRYQLYECNTDSIEIEKEITYIKNYVSIQSLRLEDDTDIQLNIQKNMTGFNIAPLLIQPIIENAFKHISHFKEASSNSIYINIEEKDNHLYVAVSNTFDKNNSVAHLINNGGLGIKNLQRRLELLYPNRFMFETTEAEHIFNTMLKIKFVEQKHLTLYS